ncbi:P27 family phage terminase small subunit [Shimia sp. MIT1388]|uniref:P27 family phage terminase small subunit n=1 Tax=Shimia sp. MIT1388 TaxID=3096992 RepID=UPI003999AB8B
MPITRTDEKTRITTLQTVSESKHRAPPPLPPSLPQSYEREWNAIITHMQDQGIWVPQKSGLVEAYLFNMMAARQAQDSIKEHGALFSNGRQNPASAVLVRHSASLNKICEQLGLGKGKVAAPATPAESAEPKSSNWGL